ncbi:glutathione S-transferase family protein [Legionella dresdenensis]|uniref:glutathione transferase n=1 Tax=Legionella dresdenensis TaxID=450200 RepID=A0ABV8CCZ2_9GAMM
MHLTLYSFRICPFVERTNIVINENNIPCERIYVDIRNKPDWFLKLSPLGKVPLLKVNDTLIFESSVINEFLDEISTSKLYPSDPVKRAYNKSWIEWGSTLIFDAYKMTLATDDISFEQQRTIVDKKLAILENEISLQPFFNGKDFSMVDIAYAPLFKRFDMLSQQYDVHLLENYPKLRKWSENILTRESVVKGFHENFGEELFLLLKLKNSCLIKQDRS